MCLYSSRKIRSDFLDISSDMLLYLMFREFATKNVIVRRTLEAVATTMTAVATTTVDPRS